MKQKLIFSALALIINIRIIAKPEILEKTFINKTKEIKLKNIGEIQEISKGNYNDSEYIKVEVINSAGENTLHQIDEKLLKITDENDKPAFTAASISKNKSNPNNEIIILQLGHEKVSHFTNKLPSNEEIIIGIKNKKNTKKIEPNLRRIKI